MADRNDIEIKEGEKYVNYPSASESCNSLGSTVPIGFAREQVFFNSDLKSVLFDVDEYVKDRLRYKSVEEMCKGFAREQIDAIATAIYNWERNGNAIIVSDQTGLGKGRIVAGLIRYSILSLGKVPIFFTEKKNLFSDIYRDLYDIGLDAGVPIEKKATIVQVDEDDLTESFIIKVIKRDIKEGELRVDFQMTNDESIDKLFTEEYEDELEEVIDLYREHIIQNGVEEGSGTIKVDKKTLQKNYIDASKEGRMQVVPYAPFPVDIKNKVGDLIYSVKKLDADSGIRDGELSNKYRLILMLYTTLQRGIYKDDVLTPKGVLINNLAEDNVIIMDESHNAAGDSLRSEILIQMLRSAKYATYVSATWAKRPSNLPLYSVRTSIRDCYLSFQQIVMAFENGGLALQEAVSSKLVSSGQLIRRDKPLDGVVEYYEEDSKTEIGQQQIQKLNRVTMMWEDVVDFAQKVKTAIRTEATRVLPDEDLKEYRKAFKHKGKVNRLTFQFFNYFLLGLKVQQCAQEALTQLRDGKKVVIAIANTLESAFTNLQRNYENQIPYNVGDRIKNDFSLMLEYLLYYSMNVGYQITIVSDTGEEIESASKTNLIDRNWRNTYEGVNVIGNVQVNDIFEGVLNNTIDDYQEVRRAIFELGLPLSPIDMIKAIIRREGYSIEEITGRTKELVFESDQNGNINFEYGILSKRDKLDRMDIVNDFNSNVLDCVIINQSGSTGLSLHAIQTMAQGKIVPPVDQPPIGVVTPIPTSLEPRNEVKQRCMLILQMELNVATEMQKLGRINRNGQIYPPLYKYIISAIPSEARLSAMMQKKLKSLMASTTGEQDFGKDVFNLDDLFSETAVIPWNDTCKDLMLPMQLYGVTKASDIEAKTKLFYFMSYDMQNNFFNTLSEKLQKHIIDLTEKGQYFAKIKYQDYQAKTDSIIPFIIGDNNATSEFANHTFAELSECTVYDTKNTEYLVKQAILDKSQLYDLSSFDKKIYNNLEDFQSKAIAQAEEVASRYIAERKESITERENQLQLYQDIKANTEANAKKIPLVDSIVQLEEEIVQLEKEKTRLNSVILKNIEDDVEDKNIAPQVQQVSKQLKQLSEQLKNLLGSEFANSGEVKTKVREIERTIRNADMEIEYNEKAIARFQNEIYNENLNKSYYIDFVSNIGTIYNYKNFEEVVVQSDATNDSELSYLYNINIDSDAVLVGVKFDFGNEYHFTRSSVNLTLMTITHTYDVTLSVLYPSFSEEEKDLGMKPTEVVLAKNQKYDNYWDNYIKGIDTGYRKNKVFLSGNLLRGIAFNYLLNLGGNITKYSTDTNKLQISLELNEASSNQIMPKFNDGTNYSLLAGLSIDNITRLFPQMLATAIFYRQRSFVSQLMYDGSNLFIICTLADDEYQKLSNEVGNYLEEEDFVNYAKYIIKEDFEEKVIFTISAERSSPIYVFDNISNGLGSEAQYNYGDVYNYRSQDKKHFLFEIETTTSTKGRGRKKQEQIDWGSPIETFMAHPLKSFIKEYGNTPLNKVDYIISQNVLENIRDSRFGESWFSPKYNLTMSPSLFYSIITYLKAQFVQLVGVISSDNLNRSEPKYIFDIASLTKGAIDNTGIVQIQGVGNSLFQPLEDIVNEFLAYYKSTK